MVDTEGMIPRIREGMSLHQCLDLYQRTLDAPNTPMTKEQKESLATYTPEQLAELYAASLAESKAQLRKRSSIAQFERQIMLERQREGIARAKAAGK